MQKRKMLIYSLLTLFLMSTVATSSPAFASPLKDLQKEQKQMEQKKKELNSGIKSKESEIKDNQAKINATLAEIKTLNAKISDTNVKIEEVEGDILLTTEEIEALQLSILDLEKRIAERDVVLRERARSMQTKGGKVSYLDVLLGANSFSDFIDRFSAVAALLEADKAIMKQQVEDKELLEVEKALVEQKLAELEVKKAELEDLKASLEGQKQQMNKLIDSLEAQQAKLEKEKGELEDDLHHAYEVSKELEDKIKKEQARLAEIARKAEEERKRREAEERKNNPGVPSISSGTWTTPTVGRFSSSFGWRVHPITGAQRQHRGLDIANSIGTPIVAAGSGVISYAGALGTYGNVVMVTHSVNGQIYTTVYAHLSTIQVSSGQYVDKGQQIAKMGNTGGSTGPHLHFEFHIGGWSSQGPSAQNPLKFVPF